MREAQIINAIFGKYGIVVSKLLKRGKHYYFTQGEHRYFVVPVSRQQVDINYQQYILDIFAKGCCQVVSSQCGNLIEPVHTSFSILLLCYSEGRSVEFAWTEDRRMVLDCLIACIDAVGTIPHLNTTNTTCITTTNSCLQSVILWCQEMEDFGRWLSDPNLLQQQLFEPLELRDINNYFYQKGLNTAQELLGDSRYWQQRCFPEDWSDSFRPFDKNNFWIVEHKASFLDYSLLTPGWSVPDWCRLLELIGTKVNWDADVMVDLIKDLRSKPILGDEDLKAVISLIPYPNRYRLYIKRLPSLMEAWLKRKDNTYKSKAERLIQQLVANISKQYLQDFWKIQALEKMADAI